MRWYWYSISSISHFKVGCEAQAAYDPILDEMAFERLLGPKNSSIVQKQPTISELVNRAKKFSTVPVTELNKRISGRASVEIH